MKLFVYPIKSIMAHDTLINKDSSDLLDNIKSLLKCDIEIINDFNNFKKDKENLLLILVQSGGSENFFKENIFNKVSGPYYLLTYGSNNSFAASLEILTFIRQNNEKGEIFHGDVSYISKRIEEIIEENSKENKPSRLGVFGIPSDWLIGSLVNYKKVKNIFNIDLIDINEDEIISTFNKYKDDKESLNENFDKDELIKLNNIYKTFNELIAKYELSGYTIRCFDLLKLFNMSPCLALSYHNKDDIIASCEGDIPSMITAYLIFKKLHKHAFQANPQVVNTKENILELAHCTLPLDMCENYHLTTHFESSKGIGIHGDLHLGDCTIVKISPLLDTFYVEEGLILNNEERCDRCRTQIKVKLNDVVYFLKNPLGNHHLVVYGHHKQELSEYFKSFGLLEIN